jgi:trans-aconitate methyltransferase
MTFEELVDRYLAGETNLYNETAFLFNDPMQGESAVHSFARELDEKVGAAPYNLVMQHLATLKEKAKGPQFNEKAAADSELYKQSIQRGKVLDMAKNEAIAENVTNTAAMPMRPVALDNKAKLFPDNVKDQIREEMPMVGGNYMPKFWQENKTPLIVAALVLLGLLFMYKK